ncbi:MAG: serine/threonine-protein kinase [Gemmataceae bacterium]
MPAPATIEDFLEVVRKSHQVDADRLDAYLVQQRQVTSLPPDPKKLAAQMVRAGLLTTFQAEQFLQGRYKGFHIGGYRLIERLGAGGTGAVFLAEHEVMKRRVALKILSAAVASEPAMLKRFEQEAQAAGALDHPNIVRAHDFRREGNLHILVMEYVKGPSLQQVLDKRGPLDVAVACDYIRQAAIGLQHAHEAGIVHRDIKPANLLVDASGVVKILDMGLARFAPQGQESLTRQFDENAVMGTADYLAPEQGINLHDVDHRADIYSLGATLYAVLAGEPPFNAGSVTQKLLWHQMREPPRLDARFKHVPTALADIVSRMMAKSPDDRYQTAAEVAEVLTPFCSASPTPQGPPSSPSLSDSGRNYLRAATGTPLTPVPNKTAPPPNDALTTPRPWQKKPAAEDGSPREEAPRPPAPEPDEEPASNLVAILSLVAVMSAVLLLIGGVIAFLIWGSPPPVTSGPQPDEHVDRTPPPLQGTEVPKALPDAVGELFSLRGHTGKVERLVFTPDGKHLLSGGEDRVIRVWDVLQRQEVKTLTGHTGRINFLSMNAKGDRLLSACEDGSVRVWVMPDGKHIRSLPHTPKAWAAVFGRNDNEVIVGGEPYALDVWNLPTDKKPRQLQGHTGTVNWLAYRPTGNVHQVLSASWDKTVKVWDLNNGKVIHDLKDHNDRVNVVAVTPNGQFAVSGGSDRMVRLWDLNSGKHLHAFPGHTAPVWTLAVTPDSKRALSSGQDGTILLWDLAGRKQVRQYPRQSSDVPGLAVTPDGKHFASGGHDGTVRLWGLPPG